MKLLPFRRCTAFLVKRSAGIFFVCFALRTTLGNRVDDIDRQRVEHVGQLSDNFDTFRPRILYQDRAIGKGGHFQLEQSR